MNKHRVGIALKNRQHKTSETRIGYFKQTSMSDVKTFEEEFCKDRNNRATTYFKGNLQSNSFNRQ